MSGKQVTIAGPVLLVVLMKEGSSLLLGNKGLQGGVIQDKNRDDILHLLNKYLILVVD